ncbi:MAG TPA: alpha/beta fold hydrolase [Acetobacteraceae bacterium]|nr:alpha/beta fold hydrolase [Acetobacteraceae bacterium]
MQQQTEIVEQGEARVRVRSAGSGEVLVLLPGMGRPASDLDPFAELLVQAGYRVLQPDPRGLGSEGTLHGLTLHDLAADVAAVIEGAGSRAVVIGHGFGNRVARMVAADRPDLVRAVVLLGCSGLVQPTPEIAEAIRLAQAEDTDPVTRERAVRQAWFGPDRDITAWLSGWSQPVMRASQEAASATDTATWWTAGRAPVVIVQGLADVAAPPENGRRLKEQIGERAVLVELEGLGHALVVEDAQAVAEAVIAELRLLPA